MVLKTTAVQFPYQDDGLESLPLARRSFFYARLRNAKILGMISVPWRAAKLDFLLFEAKWDRLR